MSVEPGIEDLEDALLDRARRLADEARASARQNRDRIIEEENERLRLREEREVLFAKSLADRVYRRKVQASELRVHGELDRLRWHLVQQIFGRVESELADLVEDESRYISLFQTLLSQAASCIKEDDLVAEVNERDQRRLSDRWESLVGAAAAGRTIELSGQPFVCTGGVRLRDRANRIRVDNTFEGRIERLRDELTEVVLYRVFGHALNVEDLVHG